MTGWPSIQDYNKALLSDKNNLRLSGLEDVALERNNLGLPNVLSGGFAYVYQLSASSGKKPCGSFIP